MTNYKIVSARRPDESKIASKYAVELEELSNIGVEIIEISEGDEITLLEGMQYADAILASGLRISEKIINGLEKCKIISLSSVGLDTVDVNAATANGIPVTNCPDTFIQEVAEHTATLILGAHRRLVAMDRGVREGHWNEGRATLYRYPRLQGLTLGMISFGNIPRAVVPLMKPFGLRILAYDPFVKETTIVKHGVQPVGLTELLQCSDIVSNHLPGTGGTTKIVDEEKFRLMKPQAIFINTGRGTTVDEQAMIRALQEGWISHAALDVLEVEPPAPKNPLLKMDNVTLTAHVASASSRFIVESRRRASREVALALQGLWPIACVNPSVLEASGLKRWQKEP